MEILFLLIFLAVYDYINYRRLARLEGLIAQLEVKSYHANAALHRIVEEHKLETRRIA